MRAGGALPRRRIGGFPGVVTSVDAARPILGRPRRGPLALIRQIGVSLGVQQRVVTAQQVRDMLGLSDRGAIRRLFALLLEGPTTDVTAQDCATRLLLDPGATQSLAARCARARSSHSSWWRACSIDPRGSMARSRPGLD